LRPRERSARVCTPASVTLEQHIRFTVSRPGQRSARACTLTSVAHQVHRLEARAVFNFRNVLERLKGKVHAGDVLAVLLCGCESWYLTAEAITRLRNWYNKRICEICRVTICQTLVHQITSVCLQKRTGVFSL